MSGPSKQNTKLKDLPSLSFAGLLVIFFFGLGVSSMTEFFRRTRKVPKHASNWIRRSCRYISVLSTWLLTLPVSFLMKSRRALDLPFILNPIMGIYEYVWQNVSIILMYIYDSCPPSVHQMILPTFSLIPTSL